MFYSVDSIFHFFVSFVALHFGRFGLKLRQLPLFASVTPPILTVIMLNESRNVRQTKVISIFFIKAWFYSVTLYLNGMPKRRNGLSFRFSPPLPLQNLYDYPPRAPNLRKDKFRNALERIGTGNLPFESRSTRTTVKPLFCYLPELCYEDLTYRLQSAVH